MSENRAFWGIGTLARQNNTFEDVTLGLSENVMKMFCSYCDVDVLEAQQQANLTKIKSRLFASKKMMASWHKLSLLTGTLAVGISKSVS